MGVSSFVFEKENPEFLAVLEAVSVEKNLKKDVVSRAVESAFESALTEYFKNLYSVSIKIKSTGAVSVFKKVLVAEEVVDPYREISLEDATQYEEVAKVGSELLMPLEVVGFSSNIIRNIGFLIGKEITTREKEAEFNHFQKLKGFIVSGIVRKVYFGGLLVGLDRYEAFLGKNQMLPTEFEKVKSGDRLEALLYEVERNDVKPQALLTRSSEDFLLELLKQAIPEIMDETVQIKAIARDPGSRAKVAVFSKDQTLDPVLLCVSTYNRKIRSISKELCGERIDIVEWDKDPAIFIMNALKVRASAERDKFPAKPINIINITVDYENKSLDIIIAEDDISLAIGRKGQNVRLLTKLIGWPIHLVTKEESSQEKFDEITVRANVLMEELNIDEIVAQLLVIEKFDTVEKIANASVAEIANIEGFETEVAESIRERAVDVIRAKDVEASEKEATINANAAKLSKDAGLPEDVAIEFVKAGIMNKAHLSELSIDEVVEDFKLTALDTKTISDSIMKARDLY